MGQKSTKHINDVMNETVAKTEIPPAIDEANKLLQIKRNQIFIEDDSFIGDPYSLLGRVIEVRSNDGNCDNNVNNGYAEFSVYPIPGVKVNENSKIKQQLKTKSLIVDNKLSLEVGFLNFLSSKLDNESLFSVIVYDQAVGLLDIRDPSYLTGMRMWIQQNINIINDPEICHLLVVTGMVQKNIIRKKYKMFNAKAKGGGYGLSVNGSLYTSNEDYSLDMRFGLSYQKIPIPNKTDVLTKPTVLIAKSEIELSAIDDFLSLKTNAISGLEIYTPEVKSEFIEKFLLPSESEINFIDKLEFKK